MQKKLHMQRSRVHPPKGLLLLALPSPHTWGMAAEHTHVQVHLPSPQQDRGLWTATNWPNQGFFSKSASNLCTPRGHWLGRASQLGGSQPQPVSWFIQPVKSTPMLNPEGASFAQTSLGVSSCAQQILSAHVKLCPGVTSPSQSWARRNQGGTSSTRSDRKMETQGPRKCHWRVSAKGREALMRHRLIATLAYLFFPEGGKNL